MEDIAVGLVLATIFGLAFGWNTYTAIVYVLLRARKGAPLFSAREGALSGALLLSVGIALTAAAAISTQPSAYRIVDVFVGALVAGAALHQLWLCWRPTRPKT